MIAIQRP